MRKEHYERVIERTKAQKLKGKGGISPTKALDNFPDPANSLQLLKPEEFAEDLGQLDQAIEELSRSVRMEHLEAPRVEAAKEEARKQLDQEHRRARQKEQQARDPHRKVALRLENKRRFESDEVAHAGVPMASVDVRGGTGCESVAVVDVKSLRQKCNVLNQGHDVRAMLDRQKQAEQQERVRLANIAQLNASLESVAEGGALWPAEQNYEERLERVKAQNQMYHIKGIIRKIEACRSKEPHPLPFSISLETVVDKARPEENANVLNRLKLVPGGGLLVSQRPGDRDEAQAVTGPNSRRTSNVTSPGKARRRSTRFRTRVRHYWVKLRALARILVLYLLAQRRTRAINPVVGLLKELGEWVRVKRTIQRFIACVVSLQRNCRQWVHHKRRRCELLAKEWQRVEDNHLASYFKLYSQEVIMEMKDSSLRPSVKDGTTIVLAPLRPDLAEKAAAAARHVVKRARQQRELVKMLEKDGGLQVDWRAYRIPAEERRAMISHFYSVKVRKRARSQESFHACVRKAIAAKRENAAVLECELDEPESPKPERRVSSAASECKEPAQPAKETIQVASMPAFWHFTEEEFLMLIAMSAQALIKTTPFCDHPANKGLPEPYRRARSKEGAVLRMGLGASVADRAATRLQCVDATGSIPIGRLRSSGNQSIGKGPKPPTGLKLASAKPRMDIDEVFRRFTPRLRDISEEQACEAAEAADCRPSGESSPQASSRRGDRPVELAM